MRAQNIPTVKEFADRHGLGRSTLYDLVRGPVESSKGPSTSTLVSLARALGRPTHEILYLLNPDAPGADVVQRTRDLELQERRATARTTLKAYAAVLPDTKTFIEGRAADHGEQR